MSFSYILKEMLLMMGFTFLVGIALAYLIKLMALFFPATNGRSLSELITRDKVWWRAYRMNVSHIYRAILYADDSLTRYGTPRRNPKDEIVSSMERLAEYHLGSTQLKK